MHTTRPSLLLRIRDPHDTAAWTLFDRLYRPLLRRYAEHWGLCAADAEDIAQTCLAEVHKRIGDFEYDANRGRFKGWLRTMVSNRVKNLLRGRRERAAGSGVFAGEASPAPGPEEEFERLWRQEHLWFVLAELEQEIDARTFEAFRRYVIEQQPAPQVAAAVGISANNLYTIKWRLTERIAERMRALLGDAEWA